MSRAAVSHALKKLNFDLEVGTGRAARREPRDRDAPTPLDVLDAVELLVASSALAGQVSRLPFHRVVLLVGTEGALERAPA